MIKNLIITVLLFLSTFILKAQNESALEKQLNEYMNSVRNEVYSLSPKRDLYNVENAQELIQLLEIFYTDTIAKVRSKAYYLTYKVAYKSEDSVLRNLAVFNLVLAMKDKDTGNIGNVLSWLSNFTSSDFDNTSNDSLRNIFHKQTAYVDEMIKLVGFVGLNDQTEYLKNMLGNNIYSSNKVVWAVHLALARLGVSEEVDFCVDLVKKQKLNDDVVYELLPDLVYIRDKKAINYLVEILHDETKNCYSANPENPKQIVCGYRVMEYLAPIIKDFPLEYDDTGDLIVDDYKEALKITRNWFKEKFDNYSLIKYTY